MNVVLCSDRYVGEFRDGQISGRGTLYYEHGDRFEGYFKDGKRWGKGGVLIAVNGDRYEGAWKHNKMCGRGLVTMSNGDKYEGDFWMDKRHGKGKLTWADKVNRAAEIDRRCHPHITNLDPNNLQDLRSLIT